MYARFGHKDFYLALGYKSEVIKEYFLHYRNLNADFTIDLGNGDVNSHQTDEIDWKVTLVDTGLDSMTGGRIKRMQPLIGNEPFLLTYGDGVADIDISALVDFHRSHGKMVTISAVHPAARFGELDMDEDRVICFQEKPQTAQGWINGGYFVIEPEFFDLIEGDSTALEKQPLEQVAKMGELMAYRHHGFWQCMDTKRDKDLLEDLWQSRNAFWEK
jgi:glucose-1-phosphate cytidylyltransferase